MTKMFKKSCHLKVVDKKKEEISIPIIQTNQPSIKVSSNKEKETGDKMETC